MKIYVDEAGRGPLAGPVTVGVVLPWKRFVTKDFSDSKGLTEKRRESSYVKAITLQSKNKVFFSVGRSTNKNIDTKGIISSLQEALCSGIFGVLKNFYRNVWKENLQLKEKKQLETLFRKKRITPQVLNSIFSVKQSFVERKQIVIDGNHDFGLGKHVCVPIKTIIKGDSKVSYIGFASIAAKVERDKWMCNLPTKYDKYQFKKHKGYGTKVHREAIKKYGCSDLHRTTFCQNILGLK